MSNDAQPIYFFYEFNGNFGAFFGIAQNENAYKSLFLVMPYQTAYTDIPSEVDGLKTNHSIVELASKKAFKKLFDGEETVVSDDTVPVECRQHCFFDADGMLNHITPETDGQWLRLTGITPEDMQNAFMQIFVDP